MRAGPPTSMTDKPFIDTNVLVYAYTFDERRNERATSLLASGGVVSVQVLNEFVNVSRRKLKFSWDTVSRALAHFRLLLEAPVPLTIDIHADAVELSRLRGFGIYDSLILATARRAGCRLLYSEDLQDGQTIDGVLVNNPFALD